MTNDQIYVTHWNGYILILLMRLDIVFQGPVLRYRSFTHCSIALISIVNLGHAFNVVLFLLEIVPFSLIIISSSSLVVMLLFYSQMLVFVFVQRLFRISKLAERNDELMGIMTRFGSQS